MITQFENGFITKSKLNEMVDGINGMTANEIIYVGNGQMYTTLSSALDYAKNRRPNKDYKIEIIIKSGTIISEQLIYENANFGHVILSSEDLELNVDVDGFTVNKYGSLKPFFYLKNGIFPFINTKIKGNDTYEKYKSVGFYGINSYLEFEYGGANKKGANGFICGVVLEHSKCLAMLCEFKNIVFGIRAKYSNLELGASDLRDCLLESISIENCTASISSVNMNGSGGEHTGLSASNSIVNGDSIVCNAKIGCLVGYGGSYRINGGGITGNSTWGILLVQGGIVNAQGTSCTLSQAPNTITANGIIFK